MVFKSKTGDITTEKTASSQKHQFGSFVRKTVLVGTFVLATSSLLNAQVKQILFPKDSLNQGIKFTRALYLADKRQSNQTPAPLEFVGSFEGGISKDPHTKLKLNNDIALSVAEQKALLQKPFFENDTHVFFYVTPKELDGVLIFNGSLDVFKKK